MAGHTKWSDLKAQMKEKAEMDKVDPKAVRAWAVATGRTVGKRGRLDAKLVAEFVAETGGKLELAVKVTAKEAKEEAKALVTKVKEDVVEVVKKAEEKFPF